MLGSGGLNYPFTIFVTTANTLKPYTTNYGGKRKNEHMPDMFQTMALDSLQQ